MPAVLEYKCPSCGGGIAFDSEEQKMKCPYCYTEFDADVLHQFNAVQEDRSDAEVELQVNGTLWEDDRLQGFICPSCAGELIGDSNTAATRCP